MTVRSGKCDASVTNPPAPIGEPMRKSGGSLELPSPGGSGTFIRHLTFSKLPDAKVRQLSERSTDGGKTWITEYDFTYAPKSK